MKIDNNNGEIKKIYDDLNSFIQNEKVGEKKVFKSFFRKINENYKDENNITSAIDAKSIKNSLINQKEININANGKNKEFSNNNGNTDHAEKEKINKTASSTITDEEENNKGVAEIRLLTLYNNKTN